MVSAPGPLVPHAGLRRSRATCKMFLLVMLPLPYGSLTPRLGIHQRRSQTRPAGPSHLSAEVAKCRLSEAKRRLAEAAGLMDGTIGGPAGVAEVCRLAEAAACSVRAAQCRLSEAMRRPELFSATAQPTTQVLSAIGQ